MSIANSKYRSYYGDLSNWTINHGRFVIHNSLLQHFGAGNEVKCPSGYRQTTQKFEVDGYEYLSTLVAPENRDSGKLIFPKLPSYSLGYGLLYRMAHESILEWSEMRENGQRHYRIWDFEKDIVDEMLNRNANHSNRTIPMDGTTINYVVTKDAGRSQRHLVYVGKHPLFIDPFDTYKQTPLMRRLKDKMDDETRPGDDLFE